MAFSLLAHTGGALGANGGTTADIDATGAGLITVCIDYDQGASFSLSDNFSNSYTAGTAYGQSISQKSVVYYKIAPSAGAGFHVSIVGTGAYITAFVQAWSCSSPTLESAAGQADCLTNPNFSYTASNPGNNEMEIIVLGSDGGNGGNLVATGVTALETVTFSSGVRYGGSAYYILPSASVGATNLGFSGGTHRTIASMQFLDSGGGGAGVIPRIAHHLRQQGIQ